MDPYLLYTKVKINGIEAWYPENRYSTSFFDIFEINTPVLYLKEHFF